MEVPGTPLADAHFVAAGRLLHSAALLGARLLAVSAARHAEQCADAHGVPVWRRPAVRLSGAVRPTARHAGHDLLGCAVHERRSGPFRRIRHARGNTSVSTTRL